MAQRLKARHAFSFAPGWATMFASQVVDFGASVGSKSATKTEGKSVKSPFKNLNFSPENIKRFAANHKKLIFIVGAILVILTASLLLIRGTQTNGGSLLSTTSRTNFNPQTQIEVNRRIEMPIRDESGQVTGSTLPITITTADRSKRILIQGKPATSRDGKMFLILNLEIDNNSTNQLTIRPIDFIRLLDNDGKSFAPDVHNNEVKAEPISIKKTRVGFVVDENQKSFKFQFGELSGSKDIIEIAI